MIDEKAQAEFIKRFTEASQGPRIVFTSEIVDQLSEEFGIPIAMRDLVGQILEVGARQWSAETQFSALGFEKIRKELRSLEKAAKAIVSVLENLSADTQQIMVDAGDGRTLGGFPLPRVSMHDSAPVLEYAASSDRESRCISLAEARSIFAALGQCAVDARPMARATHKGRPEQEALFDLLHVGFHVWASLLCRAFKLDWASDGEPITDAAMFSVRIARVVDSAATLQQIATAARKVREKGMPIRDLEEKAKVVEHYRKQYE
jgi:hypothetical protein